jgi:hypothetical protein
MFRRVSIPIAGFVAFALIVASLPARGADESKDESPKADAPELAPSGPDYQAQGEYIGSVTVPGEDVKIGVQIVALGKGKFKAVSYQGGLPGDGWEREPRIISIGEMKDGTIEFKSQGYSSKLKADSLDIMLAGVKIGSIKKTTRKSKTLGAKPPAGAVVLFDGTNADNFEKGRMTKDGLLMEGCTSKEKLGSGKLHVEFLLPFMPEARDQGRGNSGVYVQGRYEVQVLDSFGEPEADNGCGALYSLKAPDQNMCYPPGEWQTYDIDFTAADYKDGKKVKDPSISVKQNDVSIIRKLTLPEASPGAPVAAGEEPGPLHLQDHHNPVRYRNIWFEPKAAK